MLVRHSSYNIQHDTYNLIMHLAFSSNAYLNYSIEETIHRVASLGYQGIELLADVPHAWPAGLLPERKESIRNSLAKHDLTISNINAFMMNAIADPRQPYWHPGWTDPDPHYRAIRREHTKRALQLAAELEAPHITTEPGGLLAPEQTWQQASDLFYDELMPCHSEGSHRRRLAAGRMGWTGPDHRLAGDRLHHRPSKTRLGHFETESSIEYLCICGGDRSRPPLGADPPPTAR